MTGRKRNPIERFTSLLYLLPWHMALEEIENPQNLLALRLRGVPLRNHSRRGRGERESRTSLPFDGQIVDSSLMLRCIPSSFRKCEIHRIVAVKCARFVLHYLVLASKLNDYIAGSHKKTLLMLWQLCGNAAFSSFGVAGITKS